MNARTVSVMIMTGVAIGLAPRADAAGWPGGTAKCAPDSVKVGATCVDKYEASVWEIPHAFVITSAGRALIKKIQKGRVTLTDLTNAGAVQEGCIFAPFSLTAYPSNFPGDGNWTPESGTDPPAPGVYAVSIPGVLPSTCITWFRAEQACALSNKRLIRNQEWQRAAASTPDPGTDNGTTDCAVSSGGPANTGARTSCVSAWGAYDMVGNAWEWVGDWGDRNIGCTDWTSQTGIAGGDISCFGGEASLAYLNIPGALVRGGHWGGGTGAGVFAVDASNAPSDSLFHIGFRCAR